MHSISSFHSFPLLTSTLQITLQKRRHLLTNIIIIIRFRFVQFQRSICKANYIQSNAIQSITDLIRTQKRGFIQGNTQIILLFHDSLIPLIVLFRFYGFLVSPVSLFSRLMKSNHCTSSTKQETNKNYYNRLR